ncbi:MAG: hypothetical protein RQ760_18145 [Sedimentisphaerales bacterium]|nr:hypothetical protein [Sedimentisphaerales bacterium]
MSNGSDIFLDIVIISLDKKSITDDNTGTSLMVEPSGPRTGKLVRAFLLRTPDWSK